MRIIVPIARNSYMYMLTHHNFHTWLPTHSHELVVFSPMVQIMPLIRCAFGWELMSRLHIDSRCVVAYAAANCCTWLSTCKQRHAPFLHSHSLMAEKMCRKGVAEMDRIVDDCSRTTKTLARNDKNVAAASFGAKHPNQLSTQVFCRRCLLFCLKTHTFGHNHPIATICYSSIYKCTSTLTAVLPPFASS